LKKDSIGYGKIYIQKKAITLLAHASTKSHILKPFSYIR